MVFSSFVIRLKLTGSPMTSFIFEEIYTQVLSYQQGGPIKKGYDQLQTDGRRTILESLGVRYPHHGLPEWLRLHMFYNGLDENLRSRLDGATGGALMNRTYEDVYQLIGNMTMNSCQ
ncbi:Retrotransposon gag protein [Gossypium australe]|uniref:Retrotransposon gag protein n=1 Tax=Gossypium australe TaxID=47621 RepID=A0A5B6VVD9_9ROSI|nr:Retrotransposon gag protein [Gossypium australe]